MGACRHTTGAAEPTDEAALTLGGLIRTMGWARSPVSVPQHRIVGRRNSTSCGIVDRQQPER